MASTFIATYAASGDQLTVTRHEAPGTGVFLELAERNGNNAVLSLDLTDVQDLRDHLNSMLRDYLNAPGMTDRRKAI